ARCCCCCCCASRCACSCCRRCCSACRCCCCCASRFARSWRCCSSRAARCALLLALRFGRALLLLFLLALRFALLLALLLLAPGGVLRGTLRGLLAPALRLRGLRVLALHRFLRRARLLRLGARGLFGLALLLRAIDAGRGILRLLRLRRGRRYRRLLPCGRGNHRGRRAAAAELRTHDLLLLRGGRGDLRRCRLRAAAHHGRSGDVHVAALLRMETRELVALRQDALRHGFAGHDRGGADGFRRHTHQRVLHRPAAHEDVAVHDGRGTVAVPMAPLIALS